MLEVTVLNFLGHENMTSWVRFRKGDRTLIGSLDDDGARIAVHAGIFFEDAEPTGEYIETSTVELLIPCVPGKFIALWNNYRALAEKTKQEAPNEPLFFLKASNSFLAHEGIIRRPIGYEGKIVYEGELGIVIGERCANATEEQAHRAIFGFTCVNDVTALEELFRDPSFPQWTRAKSHDTFGIFGPSIATGIDPTNLRVRTLVDGRERQNYPCSDMFFTPCQIVQSISRSMTLEPGDVIACGTSVGVGPLRPGSEVQVVIDGVGTLTNRFEHEAEKASK